MRVRLVFARQGYSWLRAYLRSVSKAWSVGRLYARVSYIFTEWVLSTNHRKLAVLYFIFTALTGVTGLILATLIRVELAYPGQQVIAANAERYLTLVSVHGIVMVFFFVIPTIFGAFGNFLLPLQLGIRDVAFPRLNSFMFWVTPGGFTLLLHLILFDRAHSATYWVNYSELRYRLRRRYDVVEAEQQRFHEKADVTALAWRLAAEPAALSAARGQLLREAAPRLEAGFNSYARVKAYLTPAVVPPYSDVFELGELLWGVAAALSRVIRFCWLLLLHSIYLFKRYRIYYNDVARDVTSFFSAACPVKTGQSLMWQFEAMCLGIWAQFELQPARAWAIFDLLSVSRKHITAAHAHFLTWALFELSPIRLLGILDFSFMPRVWGICFCLDFQSLLLMPYLRLTLARLVYPFLSLLYTNVFYPSSLEMQVITECFWRFVPEFARWVHNAANAACLALVSDESEVARRQQAKLMLAQIFEHLRLWVYSEMVPGRALGVMDLRFVYGYASSGFNPLFQFLLAEYKTVKPQGGNSWIKPWFQPVFYFIFFEAYLLTRGVRALSQNFIPYITQFAVGAVQLFTLIWQLAAGLGDNLALSVVIKRVYSWVCSELSPQRAYAAIDVAAVCQLVSLYVDTLFDPAVVSYTATWTNWLKLLWLWADFELSSRRIGLFLHYAWYSSKAGDVWVRWIASLTRPTGYWLLWYLTEWYNWVRILLWAVSYRQAYGTWPRDMRWGFGRSALELLPPGITGPYLTTTLAAGTANTFFNSAELVRAKSSVCAGLVSASAQERFDYLADWRELHLEREVWRSLDFLSLSRHRLTFRRKYYTNFFEPASTLSKLSAWAPGRLIPGWAFITPYTSRVRHTAVGKVDIALLVVFMATLGSIFSAANYVITYKFIGAPLFKQRRELRSFFVDALLVASRMMLVANPALLIGIILLLSDRHCGTSTFDFSGGGDTILFQHLFWFFGHPEVYIIIIPCFGFMNSLLPYFVRKRLSGRLSLQFSMYTIAFMSFAVWGHHMYMVGLANSVRTLYSTMTVMISVPASTKVLHWCVTLIQATLVADVSFFFLLNFMYFFILGGLSGMFVAHIGFDTIFHDTFYVIGHFHVMMAGAVVSCLFGGFYFYFAAIFGVKYSRFFAYAHYVFYTAGQLLTLMPMFWLGYAGMPRRVLDYPSVFGGWHSLASSGHMLTVLSLIFFLFMLLDSFSESRAPVSRLQGVGRLNTRLAFMSYETRKLQLWQARVGVLPASFVSNEAELARFVLMSESAVCAYTFTHPRTSKIT